MTRLRRNPNVESNVIHPIGESNLNERTAELVELQGLANTAAFQVETLTERISELELTLEDRNWIRVSGEYNYEFSRQGLRIINKMARVMYLKNPLIKRGVDVQAFYVFGQGINLSSDDDDINTVISDFLANAKNHAELTHQQAMTAKDKELTLFGNLYFTFFTNPSDGRVLVRTIPADEVDEIVTNPDDRKDPWLYKRTWVQERFSFDSGINTNVTCTEYYPDWQYTPQHKPEKIGPFRVNWNTPVYHVKVGALSDMKMGVSDIYAALDWAKAYKDFLEDWATITRAYARFAWQAKTTGGKAGIAAMKAKLGSTLTPTTMETNPPPVTGATFIGNGETTMEPVKTSGATTTPQDGRRILLMVAAVMGIPETFFGDATAGSLATAKSLDRPTELKMKDRQSLWSDIFENILRFVIAQAASMPNGPLVGIVNVQTEDDGTPKLTMMDGSPVRIKTLFPPVLEHDMAAQVSAIVDAATLGGHPPANTIDVQTVSRLLLSALGVPDIDDVMEKLYPDGEIPGEVEKADAQVAEAIRGLKEAIVAFQDKYSNDPHLTRFDFSK